MAGLRSKLFRGDARLEACLVNHAKHVTRGDQGPHVAKIQCAVLTLAGGAIDGGEASSMRYGPSTARAVLAYKTRRQIINRSYQTRPDDIVGIMTIRALDDEMAVFEFQDVPAGIHA